jgi:hypothetical protein
MSISGNLVFGISTFFAILSVLFMAMMTAILFLKEEHLERHWNSKVRPYVEVFLPLSG